MSSRSFRDFAEELVGEEIEVVTNNGTFTGTLEYVGGDSIILSTRIRGRIVRRIIRIALIIAILRLLTGRRFTF